MTKLPGKFIFFLFLIVAISYPAVSELFKSGYFANHDGEGHIIRLQEFHIALSDGHFPPRLSKNLMYGYGYYFFNFNYPLPYWLGEIIHTLGANFTDSIKIISILGMVLSGLTMFIWQRSHWGNWGGLVAASLYMYAPYRFLNIYVRGSIAEHLAFVTIPLLFFFTERIVEGNQNLRKKYIIFGAISYALLLLSHNIMSFIFTLMLGVFMIFHLIVYRKAENIVHFALLGILGLALAAYFWIPSIFEKQYVRLDQTVGQDFPNHFVYPFQLIKPSWGYGGSVAGPNDGLSFQLGIVHAVFILLSAPTAFVLWKTQRKKALHVLFYIFLFALSIFFMLDISRFLWQHIPLLAFTQFPWRFLSWSVFAISVLGGATTFVLIQKLGRQIKFISLILVMVVISGLYLANHTYWLPNIRTELRLSGNQPIAGSTTWADEQFPIWFEPKPTNFPKSRVEIFTGQGEVEILAWKTAKHIYRISALTPINVVENTAYYPGWHIKVNGEKQKFTYQYKEYAGRLVYGLPQGSHLVETTFDETPVRLAADFVSLATLTALTFLALAKLRIFWKI